jgi:RimJ/RimL family protein N-acetyltransferase
VQREVLLRDVADSDMPVFFALHRDVEAAKMAGFGTKDRDVADLAARWRQALVPGTTQKAVLVGGEVVGLAATFFLEGKLQVTYWIARAHWGRGIATEALSQLVKIVTTRPLYASAAWDNAASLGVLQKCGFVIRGSARAYASARGEEIEEVFLELR